MDTTAPTAATIGGAGGAPGTTITGQLGDVAVMPFSRLGVPWAMAGASTVVGLVILAGLAQVARRSGIRRQRRVE